MLINTIILFLQDALPIFIIYALLLLRTTYFLIENEDGNSQNVKHNTWLLSFFASGLVAILFVFILIENMSAIGESFSYTGVELLFSSGYILVYLSIVGLFINDINIKNHRNNYFSLVLSFVLLTFIITLNGASFVIYFTSYWAQAEQFESLSVGVILGAGICISIAILFYFILFYLNDNIYPYISLGFLLFFGVGQLIKVSHLLEQVDILSSSKILWNSNDFLAENSEVGQLFSVLFGYDATPSIIQLSLYFLAVLLPFLIIKVVYIMNHFGINLGTKREGAQL